MWFFRLAYGNEAGIVVVDIVQKISLLNIGSPDLYGAQDPYSRVPRSPKRSDNQSGPEARSPSIDQVSIGNGPGNGRVVIFRTEERTTSAGGRLTADDTGPCAFSFLNPYLLFSR